jgi:hypothetical protein
MGDGSGFLCFGWRRIIKIDQMVYKFYKLIGEEIKIVLPSIKIQKTHWTKTSAFVIMCL